jgi:hypothetical protein
LSHHIGAQKISEYGVFWISDFQIRDAQSVSLNSDFKLTSCVDLGKSLHLRTSNFSSVKIEMIFPIVQKKILNKRIWVPPKVIKIKTGW